MRVLTFIAAVALASSLVLPTGEADPIWDFIATYDISGPSPTFSMLGVIHSVINCSAGWQQNQAVATLAPGSVHEIRVFGSYLSRVVRFEEQHGSRMNVTTYTCPGGATFSPVTVVGAGGSTWQPYFINDWSVSPLKNSNTDLSPISARRCMMIVFKPDDSIPFTGKIVYRNEGPGWGIHAWSGTYIANTLWDLTEDDHAEKARHWCWTGVNSAGGPGTQVAEPGSAMVSPVGGWRASPYYCVAEVSTCESEGWAWHY